MVDEFSSFARMPAPVIRPEEIQELVRHAVFLQRIAYPQIYFGLDAPEEPVTMECDGRLISQALTNLLKNACESIAARSSENDDGQGRVLLTVAATDDKLTLSVEDNGIGLPSEHRHRLTEPYVTTRARGTGLGLAIVRKVAEDHGGELVLSDVRDVRGGNAQGAIARMILPLVRSGKTEDRVSHEQKRVADHV
jgi:two-component system nitrogen regulation sensor histidine kinase NtrY